MGRQICEEREKNRCDTDVVERPVKMRVGTGSPPRPRSGRILGDLSV